MRVLLDTHALIWFLAGDRRLHTRARDVIGDADTLTLVSAVSALEVTIKHRLGKLPEAAMLAGDFLGIIETYGFEGLPVSLRQAEMAGRLSFAHRDPFDRLLIAQAMLEDLTLISNERVFDETGVSRLW